VGADLGPAARVATIPGRLRAAAYLDLRHDIRDTVLVVSTGRSGSTWVAEVLNHRNEYRLVFEPFRRERVRAARAFRIGQYIDPGEQDHPLGPPTDRILAGRVRSWWTDDQNRKRVARRRIVKEIRITNLLPWIRARHPELPIVYAVRDPVSVARSWLELGWGDNLAELLAQEELLAQFARIDDEIRAVAREGDEVERLVLRWCLENAVPLGAELPNVHRLAYERLRSAPEEELERLFAYLGTDTTGAREAVTKPSATADFPRVRRVEISERQRERAVEILALFGLTY